MFLNHSAPMGYLEVNVGMRENEVWSYDSFNVLRVVVRSKLFISISNKNADTYYI